MTRVVIIAALAALFASACKDTEAARLAPAPQSAPAVDTRSQFDLANAIDLADDSDDPELGYDHVRKNWIDKRYRWTVYRIAPLCRSTGQCNVLPFDRAGRDVKIVQGWMPRLEIDEADMKAIEAACGDRGRCELSFEGTMSSLVLSVDKPTSIEFSDVVVVTESRRGL